jgi:hypothetical protein
MTNGTVISGITNSSLDITSGATAPNACVTNLSQRIIVRPQNAVATGCQCCVVNTNSSSTGGIGQHTLSFGQAQNTQNFSSVILGVGTSELNSCTDYLNNTSRIINSTEFAVGVTVYGGSPRNPQPLIGYSYCVYNAILYNMNPTTGQITSILTSGGSPVAC